MKIRTKFISLAVSAALLMSGCSTDKQAISAPESDSAASEPTAVASAETTTAASGTVSSPEAEALADEPDAAETQEDSAPSDIMMYTLNQLNGKSINCENRKSLHMNSTDEWKLQPGDAPKLDYDGNDPYFEFTYDSRRFTPQARYSSGVMSAECDDAFKTAVKSTENTSGDFGGYYDDTFKAMDTRMDIDKVDEKGAIILKKVKYGFYPQCNDKMFVVNAFVRRAKAHHITEWIPEPVAYEIIIDPVFMQRLGLPMTEFDAEKMKFTVNGTDFYADTMRGFVQNAGYLEGGDSVTAYENDEFIYAKVVLMDPNFTYDNIDGALVSGYIMYIEPLTEDTDSVINGNYVPTADNAQPGLAEAMLAAKDEIITYNTLALDLIDLDFDGVPEVITQYSEDPDEVWGPYGSLHCRVFRLDNGTMKLLGEFERVEYEPFDEAVYLPTGEHGWHFTDHKDHCLLTIKNGKLNVEHITESRANGEIDENGYEGREYYYLGEKIVVDPYEDLNPLTGQTRTYYKWVSGNSLGYSVMADDPYKVYDMLYENLGDEFHKVNRYNLRVKNDLYDDKSYEEGKFAYYFEPSDNFPNDLLNVFYTDKESAVYEAYYGISFEGAKEKPVIYLYPEEQTDVSVKVSFPYGGELTCTYPEYNDGWKVTAMPDGTLYDVNGDEYYCLYWEGKSRDVMTNMTGFCVAGEDTAQFLREKLMYIGLTAREANEFIIYWLPRMQDNPYNVITLHTKDYARSVPLSVSPAPDTQIRVFMTYFASDTPVDIPEQELTAYERNGFTLVEWGGSEG